MGDRPGVFLGAEQSSACAAEQPSPVCTRATHYLRWDTESDDLGGGAHECECGRVHIDRALNLPDVRILHLLPRGER